MCLSPSRSFFAVACYLMPKVVKFLLDVLSASKSRRLRRCAHCVLCCMAKSQPHGFLGPPCMWFGWPVGMCMCAAKGVMHWFHFQRVVMQTERCKCRRRGRNKIWRSWVGPSVVRRALSLVLTHAQCCSVVWWHALSPLTPVVVGLPNYRVSCVGWVFHTFFFHIGLHSSLVFNTRNIFVHVAWTWLSGLLLWSLAKHITCL